MDTLQAVLAGLYDDDDDELGEVNKQGESSYLALVKRLGALVDESLLINGQPTKRVKVTTTVNHREV